MIVYTFPGAKEVAFCLSYTRAAPLFLPDRWNCLPTGPSPLNQRGEPSSKFGVLLLFVPEHNVSQMTSYQREMWHIAQRNRLKYCQQHGYTFINGTEWAEHHFDIVDRLKNRTHMLKSIVLEDIFRNMGDGGVERQGKSQEHPLTTNHFDYPNEELDWILFLDTDVMIINTDITIPQIIAGAQPHEGMVISSEADRVNTGALLVANTVAGRAILQAWSTGANTKNWKSDQRYFYKLFDNTTNHNLLAEKKFPGGIKVTSHLDYDGGASVVTEKGDMSRSSQLKELYHPHRITYKVVKPCALQSGGGLEFSKLRGRPFVEGFYSRGDFAVHFFGKRDKLSLMRVVDRGSLNFLG